MTSLMFVVSVTYLALEMLACLEAHPSSQALPFQSVHIGSHITLKCFYKETDGVIFYWYKQALGYKPQLISEFYRVKRYGSLKGEFWNDSRFELETDKEKNHLKILNVQSSDSATYYCTGTHSYVYEFLEGIIVNVMESDLNIWTLVQSRPETIQPGGSVNLSCTVQTGTCDGEHRVFWFRNSEEYLPRIIYSPDASNNDCKKKPTAQIQSCVHSLTIENLNASNAGTYHCAVASCGHILFGKGMKLDHENKFESPVLLCVLSGTLAFTITLVIFLAAKLYKTKSCREHPDRSSEVLAPKADDYEEADLHYAALNHCNPSRSREQRDTPSETVYSSVKL